MVTSEDGVEPIPLCWSQLASASVGVVDGSIVIIVAGIHNIMLHRQDRVAQVLHLEAFGEWAIRRIDSCTPGPDSPSGARVARVRPTSLLASLD